MLDNIILQLLLVLPIALAGILALCYRVNLQIYRRISIASSLIPLAILSFLISEAVQRGSLADFYVSASTRVSIFSFSYGMDSVSLWLCFITSIVMLAVSLCAIYIKKRHKLFYVLSLLVEALLLHIYLSRDGLLLCAALLLLAFLFLLLIGIWGDDHSVKTARRFFYWQLAGIFFITMSCILLLGINEQYLQSATIPLGERSLSQLQHYITEVPDQNQRVLAFIMMLLGLVCFIPMIGLHRPFMSVYRHSHLVVSMMYSISVGSLGIYISYRLGLVYFADLMMWISKPVIWIMGVQWLLASLGLWRQHDVKGWLAYIIWGQYSIFVILLLSSSQLGVTMMWLHMLSFQLLTALLCVLFTALFERTQHLQFEQWSGQLKGLPYMSGMLVVALLALMGLPGLSHFLGSYHALLLSFPISRWITVIAVLGFISVIAYNVRLLFRLQQGQTDTRMNSVADLRFVEALPAIILLTFIIVLGFYPILASDLLEYELHQLHRFWEHVAATIVEIDYSLFSVFDFNSTAWQLPVIVSVVMSLAIWLVNNRQTNVNRMLLWQAVYHTLTLIVVISSAEALSAELDMKRTVLIAIWYCVMLIGSYCMFRSVLAPEHMQIKNLTGLYYRRPLQAFVLMLFMLAMMSAPISAGFSYQLSMIELWHEHSQYGLIMLWLVAHALMATIPLEFIIRIYVVKDTVHEMHEFKNAPLYWYIIGYSCLALLAGLAFWL